MNFRKAHVSIAKMSTQNASTQGVTRSLSIPEPDVRVLNLQKQDGIKIQSAVDASKELQKLMLKYVLQHDHFAWCFKGTSKTHAEVRAVT